MNAGNKMRLVFSARSENESLSRIAIAAFASQLDPTLEELNDLKTVVSEAVTNCIIHGYDNDPSQEVEINASIENDRIIIEISDSGKGIEDMELARQPLFTTLSDGERAGMGFTIMENFMDHFEASSTVGGGTRIIMTKRIESKKALYY
ncbi:MAG: anti-sigma F factor [Candidatus Pristimantibacillus lignocellulolyticus]|uniref:Anti-sigma F factor n=1 Tax=Candidatus Pristimantibacillus lignocellulolyticus TaxID=2994561 RepID=A0A9J6ZDS5_9BACL|nr:MAG: anti-sigma F factor [Candidatus Pristimantibacillus lignocellulolyticus]